MATRNQPTAGRRPTNNDSPVRGNSSGPNLAGGLRNIRAFFARALRFQSFQFNFTLSVTVALLLFGLVMVLSSSTIVAIKADNNAFAIFGRQILYALIGVLLMLAASLVRASTYWKWTPAFFVSSVLLQVMTLFPGVGVNVNGNHSWLHIGSIQFQPSEFTKLAMIMLLARFMTERMDDIYDYRRFLVPTLVISSAAIVFVIAGQDLGTSLVMMVIAISMIWLSGVPQLQLVPPIGAVAVLVALLVSGKGSRSGRFTAWLNPGTDSSTVYAWQSQHGLWALAAGHFTGVGLGLSKLKWGWIPEVENDYIFAIIGEETGMVGALMVIALFVSLGFSLYRIYTRSQDTFARFVTLGIGVWLMFQAFVNIGVVLTVLPVLGVPLPLITAGGSSLISGLVAVGVCLSFERENNSVLGGAPRGRGVGR